MKSNDLFRTLSTVTTVHPPFRKPNDIEVDDTAPIPLFIGIGLPVFIGFIILVLICCFCRRRRGGTATPQPNPLAGTTYHRAPEADGMGAGAYPMTAVANSYPGYPPGQPVGPAHYTPVPPGVQQGVRPAMHPVYPQQVPPPAAAHFAPMQPFPPHQYIPIVPPSAPPHQSHSSQNSSVSGHTIDPLVPSSSPSAGGGPQLMKQQLQQQQLPHYQHPQEFYHLQHQQQQLQYNHHPSSVINRESPAPFHYPPSPYMIVQNTEPNAIVTSTSPTSNVSQTLISPPPSLKPSDGQKATTPLRDDGTDQDQGYSEGEE